MKAIRLILTLLIAAGLTSSRAQNNAPTKQWDATFGGSSYDPLSAIQQTVDGGYLLGGYSTSGISGDKTQENQGDGDYWIVKTDANGVKLWDATFGGSEVDYLSSLKQTPDGGYILGGYSGSGISGDKTQSSQGAYDYWIVKTDANGIKQWDASFGGSSDDNLSSLQQTADGGYILGGYSNSGISGDKSQSSQGYADFWIVKTDANGAKQWDARFGGSKDDRLTSIEQTAEGGFILGGISLSGISGDKTQVGQGSWDYWMVKTDANGVKQWDVRFGGFSDDVLHSIKKTDDGGYILGGSSYSGFGGDKTQISQGVYDYWIVKTDSNGAKQWDKRFGGSGFDELFSLLQTPEGGYILGGYSGSDISGDKTQLSQGYEDYWLVSTDSSGAKQWDVRFGGSYSDYIRSIVQITDGGYILGGYSNSGINGDKTQECFGDHDYWIVKVTFDCNNGITVYADVDEDSYGDATNNLLAVDCLVPNGYVLDSTDCNDSNASVHPGSTEILNGIDDNCNGAIDEGVAANTWGQLPDFGGEERDFAVGFSIGSKGYVGTGRNGYIYLNDFWEYDPVVNAWAQKADFAGTKRDGAVGFSIGTKGYLGTGVNITNGYVRYKDFWEYNPVTNIWTQKADFGGNERSYAVGFSIGNKGYIGTGSDVIGLMCKDFWEYDPSTDTWKQKSDFEGVPREFAVGFSIGNKGYIGTGNTTIGIGQDFWEYNPVADTWKRKANFGGGITYGGVGFSIDTMGYIGTGYYYSKAFWEYDPAVNGWRQKADLSGVGRWFSVGFSIGSKGYIGTGHDGGALKDFWEYIPGTITSCPVPSGLKTHIISPTAIELGWDVVGNAISYKVRYKLAGTSEWAVISNIKSPLKKIYGVLPDTLYYWEVKSMCDNDPKLISEWSEKQSFNTGTLRIENDQTASMKLYPNPVAESFTLDLQLSSNNNQSATIYLLNSLGQIVFSSNEITGNGALRKEIMMPVTASSGWYVVRVILSDQVIEQKLLYQK